MRKTDNFRVDTLTIAMLIGFIFTLIFTGFSTFSARHKDLTNSVLRVHILANSDSEDDQKIKLEVRDYILTNTKGWFDQCETLEETKEITTERLPEITALAEEKLRMENFDYSVSAEICQMDFNDRVYEDITMPAGNYTALRITLGEALGQNWWCVMFPLICLPTASDVIENSEKEAEDFFAEDELDLLKNHDEYEIRFYSVELYEKLCDFLNKKFNKTIVK